MSAESVLLADADAGSLEMERLYLEREGFRVFSVKTGFDALNSAQTIHPNLIILATELPGIDGFEVCSRLRRENNRVPIVAVFGGEKELRASLNYPLEADDFLAKPFAPRDLTARVKLLLHPQKSRTRQRESSLAVGALKLEPTSGIFCVNEKHVQLGSLDFNLMNSLMRQAGHFIASDILMSESWEAVDLQQTAGLDLHIARLQEVIAASGAMIISDTLAGFKLEV